MIRIASVGSATFDTPDMDRSIDYYIQVLGLKLLDRTREAAFLASPGEFYSVVLNPGSTARCTRVALQVAADVDFKEAASSLKSNGIVSTLKSDTGPSTDQLLAFTGPSEIPIALTRERPIPSERSESINGISPLRLGHIAFNAGDVQIAVKFFVDVLGFRVSDWMGDFFCFLRCGPDHHTVNLLQGKKNKMHHIAFEVRDWDHIKQACDFLGSQKIPLIWGPGRHGIGHNVFVYHVTPDGQIMELYTELDRMSDEAAGTFDPRPWHEDNPQRPKVWQPGLRTSNIWGLPTPERFRE